MYTPATFEESRPAALRAVIRAHPLATIVAVTAEGLDAEHIPLLLLDSDESFGVLQGHVARANPVWKNLADGSDVLAVFQGADRYVTPSWYPSKEEHGRVVPTWNYQVVHVRGTIKWTHDRHWLRTHLEAATASHEASQERPWRVSDAPEEFFERMLGAIVGFEISICSVKGKWKLSQNRSAEDRRGVVRGLQGQSHSMAGEMLEWMSKEKDD